MQDWKTLKEKLSQTKKISIVSHPSPDGDSIGSSLAVYWFLLAKGHEVNIITPDAPPQFLSFLEGFDRILYFENEKEKAKVLLQESELIFFLDFNNLQRLGELGEFLQNLKNSSYWVNIDHHQDPEDFTNFQYCFPGTSSTAELIHRFIEELNELQLLNLNIAKAIYVGILTDTGSFRFSSTEASTHATVSNLFKVGVKPEEIQRKIYNNFSQDRLQLLGFALNQRLLFHTEHATGIIYLKKEDLKQLNYQKGDSEGLVNYPLMVQSINFSILLSENDQKIKISFRSEGSFAANKFAEDHFEGGGHINAAGGVSYLSMEDTLEKIAQLLPSYHDQLVY